MIEHPGRLRGAALAVASMAAAALLLACTGDDADPNGTWKYDGFQLDGICKRPALSLCDAPPNAFSQTLWYCPCVPQDHCNGGVPLAACSETTNDCRFFADSCYPLGYMPCDQNATDRIFGLCRVCFFREAGTFSWTDKLPKVCDQMQLDGGS